MARPGNPDLTQSIGLFLLVIVGLSACSRSDAPIPSEALVTASPAANKQEVKADPEIVRQEMTGEWRLVAIDQRQLSQGGTPTVVFGEEGNCWGNTGINNFRTTFKLEGPGHGKVKLGPAAVTRKAGPPEAMALENLFLERFESANSYEVDGDLLYLHSGEEQNLTFRRVY
jgi:heat shock protein HslJ